MTKVLEVLVMLEVTKVLKVLVMLEVYKVKASPLAA